MPESTALATRQADEITEVLQSHREQIALVLPDGMNPDRLIRMGLTAIAKDPSLAACTHASLVLSMIALASLGLEPNTPLRHAFLWASTNKKRVKEGSSYVERWVKEAAPLIGYPGLIKLATESGAIRGAAVRVVHEKDFIEYEEGLYPSLVHKPALRGDAGPMIGVYCTWALPDDPAGERRFAYWTEQRLTAYLDRYRWAEGQGGKRYVKAPYRDHPEEMALKGLVRWASKYWVLSAAGRMEAGLAVDNGDLAEARERIRAKVPDLLPELGDVGEPVDIRTDDGTEDPSTPAQEAPAASLAEQDALIDKVTKMIADCPADAPAGDPRRKAIEEEASMIHGAQKAVLRASYVAKFGKGAPRA